jgi:hypothetical protein
VLPFLRKTLFWSGVAIFILYYPILISVYVKLPLFIGYAGYLLLLGMEGKRGYSYIFLPLLYLLNLEANLSLPLLLTVLSVFIYHMIFYNIVNILKRCRVCVAFISVVAIDSIYFALILVYDFIFEGSSIEINSLLLYSLVLDIVAAVAL